MSQSITVTYSAEELKALTQLIDVAVKANGLSAANAALVLHQKHVNALQAIQAPPGLSLVPDETQEG